MERLQVNYADIDYEVHFHEYMDGNVAIYLHGTADEDAFMPATTNTRYAQLPERSVIVDHWEDLAFALFKGGVIDEPLGTLTSGFNNYGVFRLTDKAINQMTIEFEEQANV